MKCALVGVALLGATPAFATHSEQVCMDNWVTEGGCAPGSMDPNAPPTSCWQQTVNHPVCVWVDVPDTPQTPVGGGGPPPPPRNPSPCIAQCIADLHAACDDLVKTLREGCAKARVACQKDSFKNGATGLAQLNAYLSKVTLPIADIKDYINWILGFAGVGATVSSKAAVGVGTQIAGSFIAGFAMSCVAGEQFCYDALVPNRADVIQCRQNATSAVGCAGRCQ